MKLLFISGDRSLAQGKKGPFYYLLEEFSKYWERIDIICPRTNQKIKKVHNNVFIHCSDTNLINQPKFILKKGLEIFKEQKFDIFGIHSYPPFYNDIGGLKLFKKIKVPYVLEIMHINGYPKSADFKEWTYKILTKLFINHFAKKAKAIRIINRKQVPEFLRKSGVDKNKLKYIPAFYIDFNIFKPMDLEKKYDLVFSGRLVKNKGIFLLLKAVKKLKIKLAIIGTGPLEDKIKKYIKRDKNIDFLGWVNGAEDLARIYNQSKALIMCSFNEGGPRVTLEAMACNIPVITSKVGIMLDIIKDQENGLFIDWNVNDIIKNINLLLSNDSLRKKIAENGFKTVQQFERKKAIKNYAQTYKNLLHTS